MGQSRRAVAPVSTAESLQEQRALGFVKRLRWTKPWFVISAINTGGTEPLSYAVMDFLEAGKP